jgi:hypothetical protein
MILTIESGNVGGIKVLFNNRTTTCIPPGVRLTWTGGLVGTQMRGEGGKID